MIRAVTALLYLAERKIEEAIARGEFDNLPGAGRPLKNLTGERDELWWIRDLVRREQIETLPPTLRLRKERDAALEEIARSTSEEGVRDIVAALNGRIRDVNRNATEGPPST